MVQRRYIAPLIVSLAVVGSFGVVQAASPSFSKAYNTTTSIVSGDLVSISELKGSSVIPANTQNATRIIGIAVANSESLLEVNGGAGTVQVATSGQANALVSTVNGPIKTGQQVAVSPFSGIGQKAGPGDHVVGLAQSEFDATTPNTTQQTVTDSKGRTANVKVGYLKIAVSVGLSSEAKGKAEKLALLQRITKSITGRTISTLRIIMALMILVFSMVTISVLIHAAVTGSLTSIGRNPLAKFSILHALWGVAGMVLAMAAATMAAIFFLLR